MCFVNSSSVINLDLFWKQVFSYRVLWATFTIKVDLFFDFFDAEKKLKSKNDSFFFQHIRARVNFPEKEREREGVKEKDGMNYMRKSWRT